MKSRLRLPSRRTYPREGLVFRIPGMQVPELDASPAKLPVHLYAVVERVPEGGEVVKNLQTPPDALVRLAILSAYE